MQSGKTLRIKKRRDDRDVKGAPVLSGPEREAKSLHNEITGVKKSGKTKKLILEKRTPRKFSVQKREGAGTESGRTEKPAPGSRTKVLRVRQGVSKPVTGLATDRDLVKMIRLNRYIALSGICSRREADQLIQTGSVKVNGVVVTELGTKISPTDRVMVGDETLRRERNVYVLLNKPSKYITTTKDPGQRQTVMELVKNACRERIYPVGRLDRMTTGLLLFTNDGDLAKKLTHPSHNIQKIYHVQIDRNLAARDMEEIARGVELEDGFIRPDEIAWVSGEDKSQVGIELHSGKNRIVRRIFEKFGYKVVKLDRVVFAGLIKKDLPRGKWRFLTEKEIAFLQMTGSRKKRSPGKGSGKKFAG